RDVVLVEDLLVADNDIALNMVATRRARPRGPLAPAVETDLAGGVAISAALRPTFRDNRIHDNGARHDGRVVGVGAVVLSQGVIDGNRIADYGAISPSSAAIQVSFVGGVTVVSKRRREGLELHVHGNDVQQPDGFALRVAGAGRVAVESNYFESQGSTELAGLAPDGQVEIQFGQARRRRTGACVHV